MTSLVFPGQGSQFVGMSKDFNDEFALARETFDLIEDTTKINIRDIIFKNKLGLLDVTQFPQLAIFSSSIAIFKVLKKEIYNDELFTNYSLGHSLGEYTALVASNAITVEDCSKLLKIRGELMQYSYKENMSGMAAILGLDCLKVENIISENNLKVEVANDNSPLQVVISGVKEDLTYAESIIMNNGAKKFLYLNVSAAFHSKIMKAAEVKMKNSLCKINFSNPLYSVISNYSGKATKDKLIIFDNLSKQMSSRVKWVDSIKLLESNNEKNIIEIGPGKVLTGIIKRISRKFNHFNINQVSDIKLLKNAI